MDSGRTSSLFWETYRDRSDIQPFPSVEVRRNYSYMRVDKRSVEYSKTMQCISQSSKDLASSLAGLANGITSKMGPRVEAPARPLQSSKATDLSRKSIGSQAISCLGVVTRQHEALCRSVWKTFHHELHKL